MMRDSLQPWQIAPSDCCILNAGDGAWAFDSLAAQLADALWLDISVVPRKYNYVLFIDEPRIVSGDWFIPHSAMEHASDKRILADLFHKGAVPTPVTHLIENFDEVAKLLQTNPEREWCLKYPLACGAFGHRMITADTRVPADWPKPFIVQEFVRSESPEVFRTYGSNGKIFGWNARRFPVGAKTSPWVAHARGARYFQAGALPSEAASTARRALEVTGLLDSFGCVDLLRMPNGKWVVLEVGTDGLFNHVDREIADADLEREIKCRVAEAFWSRTGFRPWSTRPWCTRSEFLQEIHSSQNARTG